MRITLITDGGYPYTRSMSGAWCDRAIAGLPEDEFHLAAVAEHLPPAPAYELPPNVVALLPITAAPGPAGHRHRLSRRHRPPRERVRAATHAATLLCQGMLGGSPDGPANFRTGLHLIAGLGLDAADPMAGVRLRSVLMNAWRARRYGEAETRTESEANSEPRAPSTSDAAQAAQELAAALRRLSTGVPAADINHAMDAGSAALVAIGTAWRTGTPYVLTEHRPGATVGGYSTLGVRALLEPFYQALSRLAYAEAACAVAPTESLRRRAIDQGVRPELAILVPFAVDPASCPPLRSEPDEPTIAWLGPPRDLPTMLDALAILRVDRPEVRLVAAGSRVPGAPDTAVNFLGPVANHRSVFATGRVAVLSGSEPAMPYPLIEAMMSGRASVLVADDGDLADIAGPGAKPVPAGDASALATACRDLLDSADRRIGLRDAAGRRARTRYALRPALDRLGEAYGIAAGGAAVRADDRNLERGRAMTTDPMKAHPMKADPMTTAPCGP